MVTYNKHKLLRTPRGWAGTNGFIKYSDPQLYFYVPERVSIIGRQRDITLDVTPTPYINSLPFVYKKVTIKGSLGYGFSSSQFELFNKFTYVGELLPQVQENLLYTSRGSYELREGALDTSPYHYVYLRRGFKIYYLTSHSHYQMPPDQFVSLCDISTEEFHIPEYNPDYDYINQISRILPQQLG